MGSGSPRHHRQGRQGFPAGNMQVGGLDTAGGELLGGALPSPDRGCSRAPHPHAPAEAQVPCPPRLPRRCELASNGGDGSPGGGSRNQLSHQASPLPGCPLPPAIVFFLGLNVLICSLGTGRGTKAISEAAVISLHGTSWARHRLIPVTLHGRGCFYPIPWIRKLEAPPSREAMSRGCDVIKQQHDLNPGPHS